VRSRAALWPAGVVAQYAVDAKRRKPMRAVLLKTLAVAAIAGCASSGGGALDGPRVTVVVSNEYDGTVTAYALWSPNGRRSRLGEITSGRTRNFEVPVSGDELALGVELTSAPSPGTTAGPTGFQGGAPPRLNPGMVATGGLAIRPGEGIEWQITPTGSIVYRRLEPGQPEFAPAND